VISTPDDGLAILCAVAGEGASFSTASADRGVIADSGAFRAAYTVSTFTDALIDYARTRDLSLRGRQLVMSVAGPVGSDTIRITNGRWFISRGGLQSVVERPPIILNDACAVAWSTLLLGPGDLRPINTASAPMRSGNARRHASIWFDEGVGTCALDRDDGGRISVIDSEGGHMTCAYRSPELAAEFDRLAARHGHVSYERAILHLLGNPALRTQTAALFGEFVGSIVLAYGAWDGVYLCGAGAKSLLDERNRQPFLDQFVRKGRFEKSLHSTPVWLVAREDLGTTGLLSRYREEAGR